MPPGIRGPSLCYPLYAPLCLNLRRQRRHMKTKYLLTGALCALAVLSASVSGEWIRISGQDYEVPDLPGKIGTGTPVRYEISGDVLAELEILPVYDGGENAPEYRFGRIDLIEGAGAGPEYRVFIDGTGYRFTAGTRIDESEGILEEGAFAVVILEKGIAAVCRVIPAASPVRSEESFAGISEGLSGDGADAEIMISGRSRRIAQDAVLIGRTDVPGTPVWGYERNGEALFIAAVPDDAPDPGDIRKFRGFLGFAGGMREDGSRYLEIGEDVLLAAPDSVLPGDAGPGDYLAGFSLDGEILTAERVDLLKDREPFTAVCGEEVWMTEDEDGLVTVALDGKEYRRGPSALFAGDFPDGGTLMLAVMGDEILLASPRESGCAGLAPVEGVVSSVQGDGVHYEVGCGGETYRTGNGTVLASPGAFEAGMRIAGLADGRGDLVFAALTDNILKETDMRTLSGQLTEIAEGTVKIGDETVLIGPETAVSGEFRDGRTALAVLAGGRTLSVHVMTRPSDFSGCSFVSERVSGMSSADSRGRRTVRIDGKTYSMDGRTLADGDLSEGRIAAALIRGTNRIAVISEVRDPADHVRRFSGRIDDADREGLRFTVGEEQFLLTQTDADVLSWLYPGALAEGFALGDEVLYIRMIRGAGPFGLPMSPVLGYALTGLAAAIIALLILSRIIRNRVTVHSGRMEPGAGFSIILHEEDGSVRRYETDSLTFGTLAGLRDRTVSVKVRRGRIIGIL